MHGNMFDKRTFDIARITIIQQQNYFSNPPHFQNYMGLVGNVCPKYIVELHDVQITNQHIFHNLLIMTIL